MFIKRERKKLKNIKERRSSLYEPKDYLDKFNFNKEIKEKHASAPRISIHFVNPVVSTRNSIVGKELPVIKSYQNELIKEPESKKDLIDLQRLDYFQNLLQSYGDKMKNSDKEIQTFKIPSKKLTKTKLTSKESVPDYLNDLEDSSSEDEYLNVDSGDKQNNESNDTELSVFDENDQKTVYKIFDNKTQNSKIFKQKNQGNLIQFGKKVETQVNQIPFVKNIKVLYNGVKELNKNENFKYNNLQTIYVHKKVDTKKPKIIKEDLVSRVNKIDYNRSQKLNEIFKKKTVI